MINLSSKVEKFIYAVENIVRVKFKLYKSEDKRISDSKEYWTGDYSGNSKLAQDAHWRGKGIFEDEERWLKVGEENLDLITRYSGILNLHFPLKQIVEWGCGGGANAIHFAPKTDEFVGVDITPGSLEECEQQVRKSGLNNFRPILIDASHPESIINEININPDLFLCTYVYELLPSPAYGLIILKIANTILKKDAIALIQIKYNDGKKLCCTKRWRYKDNPYNMTAYSIEQFWNYAVEYGFEPIGVTLKPKQPLVNDQHYAYYILRKKQNT